MKAGAPPSLRRPLLLAVVGLLIALLASCTGRGGGQLPPDVGFTGAASFGFSFSCERGDLRIQLSYTDHGTSLFLGSPFSVHGTADVIDPVLESALCIDSNPPPVPHQLTFLGRYSLTSSAPAGFPSTCATQESENTALCRFEVTVIDNDYDNAPSPGDFFSIQLSTGVCLDPMDPSCSQLPVGSVFYTRSGLLSSGNLTVD